MMHSTVWDHLHKAGHLWMMGTACDFSRKNVPHTDYVEAHPSFTQLKYSDKPGRFRTDSVGSGTALPNGKWIPASVLSS